MIRRAEEITVEKVAGMRDGKGEVQLTKLLKLDEFHEKGRLYAKIVIPPGASIGLHQHVGDWETYYILSGEGKVIEEGKGETIVKPGDFVYTDVNESHSIENTGEEDLVFMALVLYA